MDILIAGIIGCTCISYFGSSTIICEGVKDGIKDIKGTNYYFDYKSFIKDKIKNRNFKGLGELLTLSVPIIDVVFAALLADEIRKNINEVKEYIKPRVLYNEEPKEEKKNIEIPLKRVFINKDHLEGKYTIDEIEKLNDTTGYLYKVGTIDNEYIAIIGNYNQEPNEDHKTQIVEFLFEEDIKEYKFHPENERDERLKDKLFTVYSLTYNDKLEECIKDINIERIKKEKEELQKLKNEITPKEMNNKKVMIKK